MSVTTAAASRASSSWSVRPLDDRFTSLSKLKEALEARRATSREAVVSNRDLEIVPGPIRPGTHSGPIEVKTPKGRLTPTHWSFSQLASMSRWRASDLRDVNPELVKLCIEFGLTFRVPQESFKLLYDPDSRSLRAFTSLGYERIWDHEVVEKAIDFVKQSGWRVLGSVADGRGERGLYASDQDLYIFLVAPGGPITIPRPGKEDEVLYRGLTLSNSEVGKSSLVLRTFLYRSACSNRMIFGIRKEETLSIRHSKGARNRFEENVIPWLARAAEEDASEKHRDLLVRAMGREVGDTDQKVRAWLRRRGFTVKRVQQIIAHARAQESQARTVWDLVQGGTALARTMPYADERVALEASISRLLLLRPDAAPAPAEPVAE